MMNRTKKDIYVKIQFNPNGTFLTIYVRFPDGYEKIYKLDEYDFRAARQSARDLSESLILEFYDSLGEPAPDYQIYFL